jgi:hypothetical protein
MTTVPDVCARCHATDEILAVAEAEHARSLREAQAELARLRDRCVTLAETAHVAIRARLKAEGECARLRETLAARRPAWITYTEPVPSAARMMEG